MAVPGGHWLAHWVEATEDGSDAEYVYVSSSTDGTHWSTPTQAHHDHSKVQHGLASMALNPDGGASLFWLEALKGEDGPTFLMRTIVDASGKEVSEERLDGDVCSCCPTAVAKTAKGLIVAYRGHTAKDIRDIAVRRLDNGRWSAAKIVHADNWEINACPINAAAVAAKGNHVALGWYTGAQDSPRVLLAFSSDSGSSFGTPVTLSTGHAFGYTSLALDEDGECDRFLAGAESRRRACAGPPRQLRWNSRPHCRGCQGREDGSRVSEAFSLRKRYARGLGRFEASANQRPGEKGLTIRSHRTASGLSQRFR